MTTSAAGFPARCRVPRRRCSRKASRFRRSRFTAKACATTRLFTIVRRNTRVPEMLSADLDSEIQACLMGARRMGGLFERFGREQVEACFQAILDKCRDIYRNELLAKIADGEYSWEDYVEHDGITDPKLHKIALKMTKKGRQDHARLQRHRSAIDRPYQLARGLCRRRVPDQVDRANSPQSCRYARTRRRNSRQRRCVRRFRGDLSPKGHVDHAGMAGRDQCAVVCLAARSRSARRRGGAGGGWPHAGGSGNYPLHGFLRY